MPEQNPSSEKSQSIFMSPLRKHLEDIDSEPCADYRPQEFHAAMDLLREAEAACWKAALLSIPAPDSSKVTISGVLQCAAIWFEALCRRHNEVSERLERIEQKLDQLTKQGAKIMADEQLEIDALNKIDAATTQIAATLTTQAGVVQTISTEVTALVAAQQAAGVPQSIIDQTTALATKAQAAADALTAQVPTLQAIATQGAGNPVPVPVPAAPTS